MPSSRLSLVFLLWTAPIGLLLLIIVSFFDDCYKVFEADSGDAPAGNPYPAPSFEGAFTFV